MKFFHSRMRNEHRFGRIRMDKLSEMFKKFFIKAKESPEGKELLTQRNKILNFERDQVFQFEFKGRGKPFYLEIKGEKIRVRKGVSPLDWMKKDWDKATRILTDQKTLKQVILGEKGVMEAWHEGKWDFSSRIGNSPIHSWFCILMRLARERIQKDAVKRYLE